MCTTFPYHFVSEGDLQTKNIILLLLYKGKISKATDLAAGSETKHHLGYR